jgi:hypothetical protein
MTRFWLFFFGWQALGGGVWLCWFALNILRVWLRGTVTP